jgi:hypothetical protein
MTKAKRFLIERLALVGAEKSPLNLVPVANMPQFEGIWYVPHVT